MFGLILWPEVVESPSLYVYIYIFDVIVIYVIYKALCFDVAQGRMNGAPNETRTHSCRSASLDC